MASSGIFAFIRGTCAFKFRLLLFHISFPVEETVCDLRVRFRLKSTFFDYVVTSFIEFVRCTDTIDATSAHDIATVGINLPGR